MTKTKWFSVENKPILSGAYEIRFWIAMLPHISLTRYFYNGKWYIDRLLTAESTFGMNEKDKWRGLKEKPK
jgi:hypothetical protein